MENETEKPQEPIATDPYVEEQERIKKEEEEKKKKNQDLICRICFEGQSQNDEMGDLGKLCSPCRCRGTMKVSTSSSYNF